MTKLASKSIIGSLNFSVIRLGTFVKLHVAKRTLFLLTIPLAFLAGWIGNHTYSIWVSPNQLLITDPALLHSPEAVAYNPARFKREIRSLVDSGDFATAVALLDSAHIDDQIVYDGEEQYYGVAGYAFNLPGTNLEHDDDRDWIIPGTDCVVDSLSWTNRAYRFAEAYNSRVDVRKKRRITKR